MLNFNIKKNQDYSCRQTVLVEAAKYLGHDYEMIALGNWRFDYGKNGNNSIGEKIAQIYPTLYIENIKRYHGLQLQSAKADNINLKDRIQSNLENGSPVIVHSDTYYCPWYVGYKRIYYSHFFIIIGSKDGEYQCYDPTMCEVLIEARDEDLLEGIDEILVMEQIPMFFYTPYEYLEQLHLDISSNVEAEFYENMRNFSADIAKNFDPVIEFERFKMDIDTAPLIDNIRDIFVFRIGYANMLHYLADIISPELNEFADDMLDCSQAWKIIRGKFIKMALSNKYSKETLIDISEKVKNIYTKEMNLAERILKVTI